MIDWSKVLAVSYLVAAVLALAHPNHSHMRTLSILILTLPTAAACIDYATRRY